MTEASAAGQAGTPEGEEIEVTPEMIEAGVLALELCGYEGPSMFLREAAVRVFQAMSAIRDGDAERRA